jgi:adenine-specific DNA-methyltransferase
MAGKDAQDWSDLIVQTPPLYIQEKIHPKAIIEGLNRQAAANAQARTDTPDLFSDFNGVPRDAATEFYQHDAHWSNRMILGDSLAVMSSLAERERLKGKVQCVYFDPPYGIKFNSNWQVSTRSRDVKDGKQTDISREPEQVKAFRDNWKDGVHSYLTYLRDRLTVAHDLLTDSGSIFVQIGDENVHRVRAVMDEVFGAENFCSLIIVLKTTGAGSPAISTDVLPAVADHIVWYTKSFQNVKYRRPYFPRDPSNDGITGWVENKEFSTATCRRTKWRMLIIFRVRLKFFAPIHLRRKLAPLRPPFLTYFSGLNTSLIRAVGKPIRKVLGDCTELID